MKQNNYSAITTHINKMHADLVARMEQFLSGLETERMKQLELYPAGIVALATRKRQSYPNRSPAIKKHRISGSSGVRIAR